ncbi:MAG: hypothetical protein V1736_07170 [Pseudomonadota bacterium]
MQTEKELKEFFLTVVNYPPSENLQQYLLHLSKIPQTSSHYDYVGNLSHDLEYKMGRAKVAPKGYKRGVSSFTAQDFESFRENWNGLRKILDDIRGDKPLWEIRGVKQLIKRANLLKPEKLFVLGSESGESIVGEVELYPWAPERAFAHSKAGDVIEIAVLGLDELFNLACYSLSAFLSDKGRTGIKTCKRCGAYYAGQAPSYCSKCTKKDNRTAEEKARQQRAYRMGKRARREKATLMAKVEMFIHAGFSREEAERGAKAEMDFNKKDRERSQKKT